MSVLTILEWLMHSNTVITATILIMFAFGLLFTLLKGGKI